MGSKKIASFHNTGLEGCHQWAYSTHSLINFFQGLNLATKICLWTLVLSLNQPFSIKMAKNRLLNHFHPTKSKQRGTLLAETDKIKNQIKSYSNGLEQMDWWRRRSVVRNKHCWNRIWKHAKFHEWWLINWVLIEYDILNHNFNWVLPGNMFYLVC